MHQLCSASRFHSVVVCFVAVFFSVISAVAEEFDYSPTDPELKVIRIDSSQAESFLSIRTDSQGRVFVGGREALFRYDPDEKGGYHPRIELYRFPNHTWIYDIEIRGTDVFVLTLSALYVISNGAVQTEGLEPKRLIWGVPLGHVHQCFHGLAWGPEGDLYISMGDPLWYYGDFNRPDHWGHWTFFSQPEGTKTPYTGVGGVFRCRPDGSRFQIVARGLRNSCGLTFDHDWNLFTNDNDHEGMPHAYVPGRLVHVVDHGYYSWPRGWMVHLTPDRADLLQTMFTGMGRSVPVGQAYYDETFFPEKYRDNLLVARWGIRSVTRYPLKHRGASFEAEESPLLDGRDQARPVGVAVGRGGRIFATIAYMAHNEGSPTYRSDLVMITRADDPGTDPFTGYNILSADTEKLFTELSNQSWQQRSRAHVELLRRGGQVLLDAARRLAITGADDPALKHLVWLTAASSREKMSTEKTNEKSLTILTRLADHENSSIRLQTIRVLNEYFADNLQLLQVLQKALFDSNLQVQHAAILAYFKLAGELPPEIATGPAVSSDTFLRQAATLLLSEKGTVSQLKNMCAAENSKTRLAGVLAAGFRLTIPSATAPIPEKFPLQPWRSEDVYTIDYNGESIDLRKSGRVGLFTVAEHWKVGGHTAEQEQLFDLLKSKLDDSDEQVQLQAAHFLSLLNDARTEPIITKIRKESEQRHLATARMSSVPKLWAVGPFGDDGNPFSKAHPPEQAAIDVAANYPSGSKKIGWKQIERGTRLFDFKNAFGEVEKSSVYAYCRLESSRQQQVMLLLGSDDGIKVWHNGEPVWTNAITRAALPYQDVVFLDLQPGSNDLLIRVQNDVGESSLYFHIRSLNEVAISLPEKLGIESLGERLKVAAAKPNQSKIAKEFLQIDWSNAAETGNIERGRKLFSADGIGCAKCHAIKPNVAVQGGPSLVGAGRRLTTSYLVESILLPSRKVSPVFRATVVVTADGKSLTGLVIGETAEKLDLLKPDAKKVTIPKSDIEERKLQNISPMPHGVVKKPAELRDLLAYLLSLKEGSAQKPVTPAGNNQ